MNIEDDDATWIVATSAQVEQLKGPFTIASLKTADFLGRQPYIDAWIGDWLASDATALDDLPLCVAESILCDSALARTYNRHVQLAILRNDVVWLRQHAVVPLVHIWNVVDFHTVSDTMFDYLWQWQSVPLRLSAFVSSGQDLYKWRRFVDAHGPSLCIKDAAQQQWWEGVQYCVDEGAELQDIVQYCVRSAALFRLVTLTNPRATVEAWDSFRLQRALRRVEDVPLVEEWFWTHGYKD
jgi:hypothetical protein